jgi:hypothetical protein
VSADGGAVGHVDELVDVARPSHDLSALEDELMRFNARAPDAERPSCDEVPQLCARAFRFSMRADGSWACCRRLACCRVDVCRLLVAVHDAGALGRRSQDEQRVH